MVRRWHHSGAAAVATASTLTTISRSMARYVGSGRGWSSGSVVSRSRRPPMRCLRLRVQVVASWGSTRPLVIVLRPSAIGWRVMSRAIAQVVYVGVWSALAAALAVVGGVGLGLVLAFFNSPGELVR